MSWNWLNRSKKVKSEKKKKTFKGHVDLCTRGEDGDWLVRGEEGRGGGEGGRGQGGGASRREAATLPATTWAATKLWNPISQLNFIQSHFFYCWTRQCGARVLSLDWKLFAGWLVSLEGPWQPHCFNLLLSRSRFQSEALSPLPPPPLFGQVTLPQRIKWHISCKFCLGVEDYTLHLSSPRIWIFQLHDVYLKSTLTSVLGHNNQENCQCWYWTLQ